MRTIFAKAGAPMAARSATETSGRHWPEKTTLSATNGKLLRVLYSFLKNSALPQAYFGIRGQQRSQTLTDQSAN